MLKNYFKIAWRNLKKNKVFSLINILGLTIGITVCMMIFLYLMNEFGFDSFHKNGKNIYRVMRSFDKGKAAVPYLSGPYATALLNDFPNEIKRAVRVMPSNSLITVDTVSFNEKKIYITDPGFFQLFTFPLIKGNPADVLKDPYSVVLTSSTAKKYFGNLDPIGKIVHVDKTLALKVTGIAEDVPANSHLQFDIIYPISRFYNQDWFKIWNNNSMYTYVQLQESMDGATLEKRFPAFVDKHMAEDKVQNGANFELALTPLKNVYFEGSYSFDKVSHGEKKTVYIFLSIAILILLIACINFMNLSTVRAVERSREVGIRKVMGALRNHLVLQFIGESLLLTLLSCVLSLGILQLVLPAYNDLLGYNLSVPWKLPAIYLFFAGIILLVGFLAGSYPAIVLSAFSPIQALKGKLKLGKGGSQFRQSLVVLQFCISVLLIIGTIVIMKQMQFVKNKELGYQLEQTLIIRIDNDDIYNNRVHFKNELERNPAIASVSMMSGEPGGFYDDFLFEVEGQSEMFKARTEFSDFEYVKTLGLKIIAGRNFSSQFPTDTTGSALVNRTAAAKLGLTPKQAIGKWIKNPIRDKERRRIVGVVEDFNFLSLRENVEPLVIAPNEDRRVILVKTKAGSLASAMEQVRKQYAIDAPQYPYEYSFMDEKFDDLYKKDLKQQKLLSVFSGLAIFIACLGLFGLASFTTAKRIKEIGVRKVLGSSSQGIVLMLSKDLLRPVFLATLISIPLGYFIMQKWLESFAYRTPLHWWIFALAALITFVIALATVSSKALKAALTNPVKSLRSE